MATPVSNQAPARNRFDRRGEIAVALALLGVLVAWLPRPSHARLRGARSAHSASPVERALTGGLVTLRAPGSRMIRVTKSEFVMGSSSDDVLAALASCAGEPLGHLCNEQTFVNELPKIAAAVKSFWLDRTEVTVEAYERCVARGACQPRALVGGERRLGAPALPVTVVNAFDAETYCRFRGARLPTEAEFERAARGTVGRLYPWGDLYNSRLANHGRLGIDRFDLIDGFEELAPIGSFVSGRTPDGFLDLAGNAAEWTSDIWTERHGLPPEPGTGDRVVKGGHFAHGAAWLRGAARMARDAGDRSPYVGFRCARSAEPTPPP